MINMIRSSAVAVAFLSAVTAVAAENRTAPVVVPIGTATLRVVEIGVPATRAYSSTECKTTGATNTPARCAN